jgi:hypothetical protein
MRKDKYFLVRCIIGGKKLSSIIPLFIKNKKMECSIARNKDLAPIKKRKSNN